VEIAVDYTCLTLIPAIVRPCLHLHVDFLHQYRIIQLGHVSFRVLA
jgi:hypothetical protein